MTEILSRSSQSIDDNRRLHSEPDCECNSDITPTVSTKGVRLPTDAELAAWRKHKKELEELAVKCAETKRNAVAQAGVMRFKVKSALEELNRLRGLAQTQEALARGAGLGGSGCGNFVDACRKLETNSQAHVPRSFQILIPRMLPALYEVRNNRNVGHVGGDVDPNHMDSVVVLAMCNWIMAEVVRVFHNLTIAEAQEVVDALAEVRIPAIWSSGDGIKRVLRPELKLGEQILLLVSVSVPDTTSKQLMEWIEYEDPRYFMRTLRGLHSDRLLEFSEKTDKVRILPPGSRAVQELIKKKKLTGI